MNTAALYHRTESEYAYLYDCDTVHLRLRTARDVKQVDVMFGDTYQVDGEKWLSEARPMKIVGQTEEHLYWQFALTMPYRRLKYAFKVTGLDDDVIFFGDRGVYPLEAKYYTLPNFYFTLPYFHEIDRAEAPQWVKETVWYQIFPERFANGDVHNDPEGALAWGSEEPSRDNFFGGDLQGVIDHLDYLQDLGISGLYFCPIFKAYSNHKYDTIDYFEIDPQFGDKETFKTLVNEAHRRGMRIMLDAVFNHSGDTAPQWLDVIENGENSPYKDWYHIHSFPVHYTETEDNEKAEDLNYDVFAFTPHMPKWNTANPEVVKYLLSIATYWIREFDIDAWRLDVANEVDHHFWRQFHDACQREKDDFYIAGEVWHNAQPWLQGGEFTGTMNYAYCENILQYFLHHDITESQLASVLTGQLMLYRDQVNRMNLNMLDSHDTARLLYQANGDKELMKKTLVFMFLQPGSPCIYYGTEVGMTGGPDPANRACMVWDRDKQDSDMYQFVKQTIALRNEFSKVLSDGEIEFTYDESRQLFVVTRSYKEQKIIGIFNQSPQDVSLEIGIDTFLENHQPMDVAIKKHGFEIMVQS